MVGAQLPSMGITFCVRHEDSFCCPPALTPTEQSAGCWRGVPGYKVIRSHRSAERDSVWFPERLRTQGSCRARVSLPAPKESVSVSPGRLRRRYRACFLLSLLLPARLSWKLHACSPLFLEHISGLYHHPGRGTSDVWLATALLPCGCNVTSSPPAPVPGQGHGP